MLPVLDTPRLLLRPMRPSDTEAFFAFGGDPDAMRYTHCHTSLRECRRRLAAFEWQRRKRGYAPWAVIAKADARLVGWGGVYVDPSDPQWGPELGYFFHPGAWGQGFATELARACLEQADQMLGLPAVSAFAHPDNAASRRVLEKVGFAELRPMPEMERILYRRRSSTSVSKEEDGLVIRELASTDSIADLTALLHAAYARLGGMGFNYTAVDQSEDVTRSRVARGLCMVASDNGALVGTIMFHAPGHSAGCPCYERPDVATIGQFGVLPSRQGTGTGTRLLREVERLAIASGAAELALDTSEGADHLITWYEREGFRFVEHAQWPGKTYRSVIMSKPLQPTMASAG